MAQIRPFRPGDAAATHRVFVLAVTEGAAGRYSASERADWLPDPAMPDDWGSWLAGHHTLVADEGDRLTGFFMIEASGYLNMAYVTPDRMGMGLADRLYDGIVAHARAVRMAQMTTLASRYAEGFFRRHGWTLAPYLTDGPGVDPTEMDAAQTMNRAMQIMLS